MARSATPAPLEVLRADTIDGWPAPEEQTNWYGDPNAERVLGDAFRSGNLHHAWMLTGPKGIGKATLAYRFARFVFAHPDASGMPEVSTGLSLPDDHPVIGKVAGRAHPNLLVLERPYDERGKRFRNDLTVSEIRRTIPFFGTTAGEGPWRIAVIDAADDMNLSAANALLKILEEPPARSLFLIVSHAPGGLLPTIRSRCRRLQISPLEADSIRSALAGRGLGEREIDLATALAEGSLRRAALFADGQAIGIYDAFAGAVKTLPSADIKAMHELADLVSGRGRHEQWLIFVELVTGWLNRRVRGLREPDGVAPPSPRVAGAPLERWAQVWDNLHRITSDTDVYNLDRRRAVLTIMLDLARATRM